MPLVLVLPELVPLVVAIGAMLMTWVLRDLIGRFLVAVLTEIPVVGGAAAGAVEQAGAAFGTWLGGWIVGMLQAAIDTLDWISGTATFAVRTATGGLTWVYASIITVARAFYTRMAAAELAIAREVTAAQALAHQLATIATRTAALDVRLAWAIATAIPAAIARAVALANAEAHRLVAAAELAARAGISAALATALSAIGQETAARQAADAAVRAAAAAEAALVGRSAAAAIAASDAAIGAEIGTLGRTIGQVDARIGAIAAPTVAIAIGEVVSTIERLDRECIAPTCSYLSPQLGILNALEDVAMLAAVAELVYAATHRPEAAAREAIGEAAPFLGLVGGLFHELTGIELAA